MKNVRSMARKYGPSLSIVGGSLARKYGRSLSIVGGSLAAASAHAADPVDAAAALSTLSGSITGFGPVLFGLALASTVIMIGIAWIKKGRGAAK